MSQKIFEKHGATKFLGYEQLESEAQVLGLSDGQQNPQPCLQDPKACCS